MKLYDDHESKIAATDKILVKDLVRARLGEQFVIPTLWSGKDLPPLSERNWPIPFVIKANHGSAMNYFVRSEADLDWPRIERLTAAWLAQDWPAYLCEEWYNKIDRQLLIEPLFSADGAVYSDYKVLVFSGRALMVQLDIDRFNNHQQSYFDRSWRRVEVQVAGYPPALNQPRPARLEEMLDAAERLGSDYDFVRVDLYDLPDGLKFGELTFAPHAGLARLRPKRFEFIFGTLWDEAKDARRTGRDIDDRVKTLLHEATD